MGLTSQHSFNEIANQLQKLSHNQIPTAQVFVHQSFLLALKGIRSLLLTYPLNVFLLIICLIWVTKKIISRWTSPKVSVYWPNMHIESHDQHIKNLKKDIRQVQNESLSFSRKVEAKRKQLQQKPVQQIIEDNLSPSSGIQSQLKSLLQQRQYIKDVSSDFIAQIKKSEEEIIKKIRKYKK